MTVGTGIPTDMTLIADKARQAERLGYDAISVGETAHNPFLPLVLVAPLIGLQFGLNTAEFPVLLAALLLGTPTLSLIGAIGAALTLGLRGSGLIALLVLPLYVPVLVFGAGAIEASAAGLGAAAHLSVLGALLLFTLVFAPWATAAALRIAVE